MPKNPKEKEHSGKELLKELRKRLANMKLANIFLLISIVFGCFFVFKTPLLWGIDETFHTMRTYQLSVGNVKPDYLGSSREKGGYGGQIPENLFGLTLNVDRDLQNNATTGTPYGTQDVDDPNLYKEIGSKPLQNDRLISYAFPNTSAYSPLPYIPSVTGMVIAKKINLGLLSSVYLMRVLNLMTYISLVYVALRILEKTGFKWIFFSVALLPMALYQASIIGPDSLTNSVAILFFALILKTLIRKDQKIPIWQNILIYLCVLCLPLLKPGYMLLVPMILLIPNKVYGGTKWAMSVKMSALSISLTLLAIWSFATKGVAEAIKFIKPGDDWQYINSSEQIGYILTHPIEYAGTISRTFLLSDNSYFIQIIGSLGFNIVPVPALVIVLEIIVLIAAILLAGRVYMHKFKLLFMMLFALSSFLIIITTLYVTYSKVGGPTISGIQGRYFIPLLPIVMTVMAIVLNNKHELIQTVRSRKSIESMAVLLVVICLLLSAVKYFYVTWG